MYGSLIKDSDSFFQLSAKFFGKFVRIFSEYHADDRQKRFGDLVSRVTKRESDAAAADGITVMSYYDDAYFDHILNRY